MCLFDLLIDFRLTHLFLDGQLAVCQAENAIKTQITTDHSVERKPPTKNAMLGIAQLLQNDVEQFVKNPESRSDFKTLDLD